MDNTLKIETPPEIATGPNGEAGYIIFRAVFKGKYKSCFSELAVLAETIQGNLAGATSLDDETRALIEKFNQAQERAYEAYAHLVLDWNWIDRETGEPLPKPNNPDVFRYSELYEDQEAWLIAQLRTLFNRRAVGANPTNGGGS